MMNLLKHNMATKLQGLDNKACFDLDFKKCSKDKISELILLTLQNQHNKNVVVDLEMSIPTKHAQLIVFWDTGYQEDAEKVIKCIEEVCLKL